MPGIQLGALGFAGLALGCAAVAAYLVSHLLREKGYTGEPMRPVVVAAKSLPAAVPIPEDAVKVVDWPISSIPAGAYADVKKLFGTNGNKKQPVPTVGILPGEPIMQSKLAMAAYGTGLSVLVQPGYRAVAIKVDDAVRRSRLVYPGAHVDVLTTVRGRGDTGSISRLILRNVRVLAVEAETDVATRKPPETEKGKKPAGGSSGSGTVVTLEVTPEGAEILGLSEREGTLDLVLRNVSDTADQDTSGVTSQVFTAKPTSPSRPKQAGTESRTALDTDGKERTALPKRRPPEVPVVVEPGANKPSEPIEVYRVR